MQNITVIGAGYVGFSMSILLSQKNQVTVVDTDKKKVELINKRISPIKDPEIELWLRTKKLNLVAEDHAEYKKSDLVIIAVPTDFDSLKGVLDCSIVDSVIKEIRNSDKEIPIIIKSTVAIGYTEGVQKRYPYGPILVSPEFLREGKALYDNLFPSRIVIGRLDNNEGNCIARRFSELLQDCAVKDDISVYYTSPTEAEAVKLFSNSYLAMRVAFYNIIDEFAERRALNSKTIIDAVSEDHRIGKGYNNPSFGFGGYCLPKDTQQLQKEIKSESDALIAAIIRVNQYRKEYIAKRICELAKEVSHELVTIGIYKVAMKYLSDNDRESAIQGVISKLKQEQLRVIIYDMSIKESLYQGCVVKNDFDEFIKESDIIVTNRLDDKICRQRGKIIYTRDIYSQD